MVKILIIADDFTGSLDTGIQFASLGIETKVMIAREIDFQTIPQKVEVLVLDIESRPMAPIEAGEVVQKLTANAREAGVEVIFKKTDSALRGNIGGELTGMAHALNRSVYFIPAYPRLNRITKNGYHYIGNARISDTSFGVDPYEPVTESFIPRIIAQQSDIMVHQCNADFNFQSFVEEEMAIYVCDAESNKEIRAILTTLLKLPHPLLVAGCAGLASQLIPVLKMKSTKKPQPIAKKGLVILVGSVNPITREQVQTAVQHGFHHIRLTPEEKMQEAFAEGQKGGELIEEIRSCLDKEIPIIIDANDVTTNETLSLALERGLTADQVRRKIAQNLGGVAARAVAQGIDATFLLTGGDTAMGFMGQIKIDTLTPIREIDQGSVLSEIRMQDRRIHIITKSGGFGTDRALVNIMEELKQKELQLG